MQLLAIINFNVLLMRNMGLRVNTLSKIIFSAPVTTPTKSIQAEKVAGLVLPDYYLAQPIYPINILTYISGKN